MQYSKGVRRSKPFYRLSNHNGNGRKGKSFFSFIFLTLIVLGVFWGGYKLVSSIFSSINFKSSFVEMKIQKGASVQLSLNNSETWVQIWDNQKFFSGDNIRTGNNTAVSLVFDSGETVFLNENSELKFITLGKKSSGESKNELKLNKGEIWAQIPDTTLLNNKKSVFSVESSRIKLFANGSMFDFASDLNEDVVRLIKGKVETDVYTDENKFKTISIGVGQKLLVNSQNISAIKNNDNILEMTDSSFLESDWHLNNLEQFSPEEVAQIRRRIEIKQPPIVEIPDSEENNKKVDLVAPTISEPLNNAIIPESQETVKIEGTVPLEAFQIIVNGFTLTKFQPGDRKWTYFASRKFGTLVPGENTYKVEVITREGQKSPATEIKIIYDAPIPEKIIETAETENDFPPPIITKPALLDSSTSYQTSTEVVTISGTVPQGTIRVTVNDFVLKKFAKGDTEFSYIANANYGNMTQGENNFIVMAYGENGKSSMASINVYYKPVSL